MTTVRTVNIKITFATWMIDMFISIFLTVVNIKEKKDDIEGYFVDLR